MATASAKCARLLYAPAVHVVRVVPPLIGSVREAPWAPGITVSRVRGVGYGYEPKLFTTAPGQYPKMLEVSKIEVVCPASDAEWPIETIVENARTGFQGDGIVFQTPVERAIKIRSGEEGARAVGLSA